MDPIHFMARVGSKQALHRRATPQEIDGFYQSDDWDAVWRMRALVRRGAGLGFWKRRRGARALIAGTVPAE
ncbi:hypothetical protein [Boseongicola aestuarii]|uniref:Uncharacterized protein n=1 Tax=Boseongicola aestuarii TaxID=1470561 RepID=A0A238J2I4_9RHOB|nr:hypothetical protein [Boseongicola aestuarii]SMX24876.1 hypothetical protein BOA8489_03007 [Boseongicola aestuarii]